jgi:hypothetical protein
MAFLLSIKKVLNLYFYLDNDVFTILVLLLELCKNGTFAGMITVSDDILDFLNIETGKLNLESTPIIYKKAEVNGDKKTGGGFG